MVAHAALRIVLSGYLKCAPCEVPFIVNEWGKLSIPNGPYFNLAHSDDVAVIAVDQEREIGVDLETGSLVLTHDEMTHVLSPDELALPRERDIGELDLLRLWVRKEAVLKSLGKGSAHDPSRITTGFHTPDFDRWRLVSTIDDGVRHDFHVLDIAMDGTVCAVARRDSPLTTDSIIVRNWFPNAPAL